MHSAILDPRDMDCSYNYNMHAVIAPEDHSDNPFAWHVANGPLITAYS